LNKLIPIFLFFLIFFQCASHRATKETQIDFITAAEEIQLGEVIQEQMLSEFHMIRNSTVNEYLNLMATEISLVSKWTDLPYRVYIINRPEPFHFALPGGGIYIYRGALQQLENHQECAALIALHVAHINLRHSIELLSHRYGYAIAAQRVMGENPHIAQDIVNNLFTENSILNFSEKMIIKADKQAIDYLKAAGYSPQYLSKVFIRLDGQLENYAATLNIFHITANRIKHAEQYARKNTISTTNSLFEKDFPHILFILSQIPQ